MEGMTESILEELSDLAPAVDCTNKEQLPTSYSLEQSDSNISGNQDYRMLSDARCLETV